MTRDLLEEAQRAAIEHVAECWTYLFWDETPPEERGPEPEQPIMLGDWFCGCEDCVTRETLWAALPYILAHERSEDTRWHEDAEAAAVRIIEGGAAWAP